MLTAAIKRTSSTEELRQLVQQHGASFDHIHCSATLTHLAGLCMADRTRRQQPAVQELLKLLEHLLQPSLLKQCGARELANVMWASGVLGCAPVITSVLPMFAGARIQEADPQALSNTLYAVALSGLQVPADQLRQMLAAFVGVLAVAEPQAISNTMWAVATMGLQVPADQLRMMLATFVKLLPRAIPQEVSNTLWSVSVMHQQSPGQQQAVPGAYIKQLLAACMKQLHHAKPQDVSNNLLACGRLGDKPQELFFALDNNSKLRQQLISRMNEQGLANTAWACGIYIVFDALQQLPTSFWQQTPMMEQRTADGVYSVDIAATTAAGMRLAIEVDGPWHFLQPDGAINGPTRCRNRALAARGYKVISIPYWEWDASRTPDQKRDYLLAKLQTVVSSNSGM